MMQAPLTYADALKLAGQLSTLDKLRLIGQLALQIERELTASAAPRQPLRGIWKGLDITDAEIAEARREMWGGTQE
jgi:hypothetical protein